MKKMNVWMSDLQKSFRMALSQSGKSEEIFAMKKGTKDKERGILFYAQRERMQRTWRLKTGSGSEIKLKGGMRHFPLAVFQFVGIPAQLRWILESLLTNILINI